MQSHNRLRIIGGQWRGRKLAFVPTPELRPTPDRARETLFNWLQPLIQGANCLDLFAGSGILGYEAISRGAELVICVDRNVDAISNINANSRLLDSNRIQAIQDDAFSFIRNNKHKYTPFDIIFLDPPFQKGLILPICTDIIKNNWLIGNGYLYIETETGFQLQTLSPLDQIKIVKTKKIGNINLILAQSTSITDTLFFDGKH